jgi:hypothetical protein
MQHALFCRRHENSADGSPSTARQQLLKQCGRTKISRPGIARADPRSGLTDISQYMQPRAIKCQISVCIIGVAKHRRTTLCMRSEARSFQADAMASSILPFEFHSRSFRIRSARQRAKSRKILCLANKMTVAIMKEVASRIFASFLIRYGRLNYPYAPTRSAMISEDEDLDLPLKIQNKQSRQYK